MSKKKKSRNQKKKSQSRGNRMTVKTQGQLDMLQELINEGDYMQAEGLADYLFSKHPHNKDVLHTCGWVYQMVGSENKMWLITETLLELTPNEPSIWSNAASIMLEKNLIFSAKYYAQHVLENWPDDSSAHSIREIYPELEKACKAVTLTEMDADADEATLRDYERAQLLLETGRIAEAEKLSEKTIKHMPGAAAPRNNLSLSYALSGHFDKAIALTLEVLTNHPDNLHATANLAQFYARIGRQDEAEQVGKRLLELEKPGVDTWMKCIESFAYLRDDVTVCKLYEDMTQTLKQKHYPPFATHLAAVSYAHQGDTKRAEKLWQQILKKDESFSLAEENLDNLKQPINQRAGAWPFPLAQWVPMTWLEEAQTITEVYATQSSKEAVQQWLQKIPELNAVLPVLLERGDDAGRDFALTIAEYAELPLLTEFMYSQNGTDSDRLRALNAATDVGLIFRKEPQRIFLNGEWQEVSPLAFEIYYEPDAPVKDQRFQRLIEKIYDLLEDRDHETALPLIEKALKRNPDHTSLLNYKWTMLMLAGKQEESEAVIRHTVEKYPDYVFARCGMANIAIKEGNFDKAHEWLKPVLETDRLHISEFRALCLNQIELAMAEQNKDAAETWLQFLEQVEPDTFTTMQMMMKVRGGNVMKRLNSLFSDRGEYA